MKSFRQYITEATMPRLKGWGNSETGKLELTPIRGKWRPYHQQFAANNLSKLGLKEKDVIDSIEDLYSPPTRKDAEKLFNDISTGKIDRHNAFADLLKKKGWYPLVFDNGINSIGDYGLSTPKRMLKIAREVDKRFSSRLWGLGYDSIEVSGNDIYNQTSWNLYLKTGGIPRQSALARFRESVEHNT